METPLKKMVLLVMVVVTVEMDICPSDRDKDHRPRTNCSTSGLTRIPPGLKPTTKVLIMSNNLFSSLSWSSFKQFPEIYEVDLTRNQIPEVTPATGPFLPTLSVLRLGYNLLSSLQDDAFHACPHLTELHLHHNRLVSLSSHSFSGLELLQVLDLTANHITVLPELLLRPLVALETLYLENNQIQVMPSDWFIQKEEVPYLFLSANPWACSCRLGYLHMYLSEYDYNVYVREGVTIRPDAQSVVCASPPSLGGVPLLHVQHSDLCPLTAPVPGDVHLPEDSDTFVNVSPPPPITDVSPVTPPTGTLPPLHSSVRPPLLVQPEETSPHPPSTPPPYNRCGPPPGPGPVWTGVTPPRKMRLSAAGVRAASFCVWLLIGCLMSCLATAAAILVSSLRMVQMFRMMKVIKGRGAQPSPSPGLYRSVLFVHREGGGARGYCSLTLRGGVKVSQ